MSDGLFYLQLIAAVASGAFIGEYYRLAISKGNFGRLFMAKVLAGSFLAWLIGYLCYHFTKNKSVSFVVAALLAYQEEDYASKITRQILRNLLKLDKEEK